MARSEASVPSTGGRRGARGTPAASAGGAATVPGSSSERRTDASTSSRFRSNSASGKAGRTRASARRSRPSPRSFRRTESTTSLESRPPSPSRLPPTNSMARSTSRADRVALPRVRSSAVRLPTPPLLGGSRTAPASTDARAMTIGMPGRSATRTTIPFASVSRTQPAAVAGAGDTGATGDGGKVWERTGVASAATAAVRTTPSHGGPMHGGIIPALPSPGRPGAAPPTCPGARGRAQKPRGSPACSARARAARG